MQKLLSYPITILFLIFFGLTLALFHPLQWICLNVFGYHLHKSCVSILNRCIMLCTNLLGTRYTFVNNQDIPSDRPVIIVSNHQSMYDISPISWYMRKHHPKFVSKKELGKGIPSVSFNLRHGGSVLIDRNDGKQAIAEIGKLGTYIEKHKRCAVIFPEGTRSRTGEPKPFKLVGLKMLLKKSPSALIVPITINNSWKLLRFGKFPMGLGAHLKFKVHPPVKNKGNIDELLSQVEKKIIKDITY